jgi:asparagine synthase (glutamine-hydrolysing)
LAEDSNMRVDKMTMLMSTEARAPFEDHHLIDLAFSLPLSHKLRQGDVKRVLKEAVRDLIPAEILERPKWGFTPPTSEWLRTTLRPLVETYLAPERIEAVGVFQPKAITALIDAHIHRRQYEVWALWPVLVFHLWHALYIDRSLTLDRRLPPADLLAQAKLSAPDS